MGATASGTRRTHASRRACLGALNTAGARHAACAWVAALEPLPALEAQCVLILHSTRRTQLGSNFKLDSTLVESVRLRVVIGSSATWGTACCGLDAELVLRDLAAAVALIRAEL